MSKKKESNTQVWQKWIDYYNEQYFDVFGHEIRLFRLPDYYCDAYVFIESRFFDVVPPSYRELMAALISCLKWHPLNAESLTSAFGVCDNHLCGHCYTSEDPGYTCGGCALAKHIGKKCMDFGSIFYEADTETAHGKYGPFCNLMYKACLAVYRKEYEKLFGTDWDN